MKLRFGAAITVARPRLDDLGGGASYTVTSDQATPPNYRRARRTTGHATAAAIRSSSPGRRTPSTCRSRSTSATQAYVSAAAYYKDLTTYIFNQSTVEDFSDVPLPVPATGRYDHLHHGGRESHGRVDAQDRTAPVATSRASSSRLSIPFSLFSDALDGFGFIVSGAKNESSIKINDVETPVPGLSTKVFNSTLYYEKYGFSARVSNRYRDDFVGEVPAVRCHAACSTT